MSTDEIKAFLPPELCSIIGDYAEDSTCDVCNNTYTWGPCKFLVSGARTSTHTHCAGCFRRDGGHTWDCANHPDRCPECKRHDDRHMANCANHPNRCPKCEGHVDRHFWNCPTHPNSCPECQRHDGKHTWDCTAHSDK